MRLQRWPGAASEPGRPAVVIAPRVHPAGGRPAASGPGGYAALLERLAAVEAGIRDDRHRQPAAVVEAIARSWSEGGTVREVAARAGVSREIVRDRLRRAGALGYPLRDQRRHVREVFENRGPELVAAYEAGETVADLAADAGISWHTLRDHLVDHGIAIRTAHWQVREVLEARGDEFLAGYRAGATLNEIAASAGISTASIRPYLVARGVTLRRGRRWPTRAALEPRRDELLAAYEGGATIRTLAADAGVNPHTLRAWLVDHGVAIRDRSRRGREVLAPRGDELLAAYEAGATIRGLAARFGVGRSTVRRFLVGHGARIRNDRGKVPKGWYAGGRSR